MRCTQRCGVPLEARIVALLIFCGLVTQSSAAQRARPASTPPPKLTASQIAKRTLPSTVLVVTDCGRGRVVLGSGFVVGHNLIATNRHVVECGGGYVSLVNSSVQHRITSKWLDPTHDLALLQVEDLLATALLLGDARDLAIGDTVYAAGNPQGLQGTFSNGIISSLRYSAGEIQFTAPISKGSSGGPVINEYGHVIGLTVSYNTSGQNLNFAVPSLFLERFMAQVRNGQIADEPARASTPRASSTIIQPSPKPVLTTSNPVAPESAPRTKHERKGYSAAANNIAYGIVADHTGSISSYRTGIDQFVKSLIDSNQPNDETALMELRGEGYHLQQNFTPEKFTLLTKVGEWRRRPLHRTFIDSLYGAVQEIAFYNDGDPSAIVLVTNGKEYQPGTHTQLELFTLLRDKRVQAQIIALPLELEPFNAGTNIIEYEQKQERQAQEQRQANELLASVARESGGRVYFLNSEKELPRILPNVVRALRLPPDYSASKAQSSANAETRTETLIREAVVPDTMPLAEAKKFIARLIEARTMGQPDVLSELLADDVELISDEGRATKVQAVTQLHKRDRTVAAYKIAEPMVRAVGGSTIVTFAVSYIGHGSLPKIALYTNTLTLSKRAGRWQIIKWHVKHEV